MKSDLFKLSKGMIALLEKHGITTPTQIQTEIIPAIMAGDDVLAQSETGSGKTLSFAIPLIERIERNDGLQALILVPTRELCVQITEEFMKFSHGKHIGIVAVYGGVSINTQIKKLKKVNIVVATPGRLLDLLDRKALTLSTINYMVFDEADRMLDMGFIPDVERILRRMPQKRQTMLFSATVSKEITELSRKYLINPKFVHLASAVKPEFLRQTYYQTQQELKLPLLVALLKNDRDLALVFCNRKHVTAKLAKNLSRQGVSAKCLHGDMSQSQRERATNDFRNKRFSVLIATDVAARGLHIEDITHVYNFEIPKDVDSYTHRVGRTARAGKKGEAISLVAGGDEQKFFKQILFKYGGSITLKSVNKADLPAIIQPAEQSKKSSGGGHQHGHQGRILNRGDKGKKNKPSHDNRDAGNKNRSFKHHDDTVKTSKQPHQHFEHSKTERETQFKEKNEKKHKKNWREKWLGLIEKPSENKTTR
ncbi:MAG: DEAD/DEAH box helicase [Ignavibacteriales bacterium]|nr:DEAD/DEAH box helicase [Ignavibacteriales bacterium]